MRIRSRATTAAFVAVLSALSVAALSLSPHAIAKSPASAPAAATPSAATGEKKLELKVEQYTLGNGLTVLLSPDPRVPIVASEIIYLVGSAYEEKGRTGFAHLFEHLMFQGSLNHDQEFFAPFEPLGAEINGTTDQDRTNYYEHVPSQYWELPLFMESDRMRSLLPVLTQEKLDNQRAVVKNERRQRYEVTPYGMAFWHLYEGMYPVGHPYHHSTIGSHEDLEAASLEDVKKFFARYYVPKNAGLVVVGDFEPSQVKKKIEEYFGDIPPGSRAPVPEPAPFRLSGVVHKQFEDDVELPRVYLAFQSPALYASGDAELDLFSSVLADGKSSRLHRKLVLESKVASEVSAFQMSERLGSMFVVEATALKGVSAEKLGEALEKALSEALKDAPTQEELIRAKNSFKKGFYHRLESVGERASLIGTYFLHTGRGNYLEEDYVRYEKANAESVHRAASDSITLNRMFRLDAVQGTKSEVATIIPANSDAKGAAQ